METPTISWVKSAIDTATQYTGVDKVIAAIRTGGKHLRQRVEEIREASRCGDKESAGALKKRLPAVLWSGKFQQRANDKLETHSGLLCADLDSVNGDLPEVREKLLASPHLWALFTSPSGEGLKAVFRVPADAAKHAGSFRAVEQHVRELTGKQIDQSCKDVARLCFLSYDPELYHNPEARELEPLPEPVKPKPITNGMVDLSERQRIATELLGAINWQSETEGYCVCPNQAAHTTGNGARDCKVWLGEIPTISCFHNSCRGVIEGLNFTLRSRIGKAEAPAEAPAVCGRVARLLGSDRKAATTQRHCALIDLNAVTPKAVDWIEEPYLTRGEMHFLQGQGGSYKGTLALTWAAEFSRRGEQVLLILAEDDLAKKVKPLLMAAGANTAFIHPVTIRRGENEDALVLPDDLAQLEEAIADTQAALVIIDPLLSHVSGHLDSYRDHDMKRVLTRIGKMAQRTNAVIVCVHHTKKDTSGGMKTAGAGSIAFYTTARMVLTMAKLSEQEVVLEVVKSNLGPEGVRQLLQADVVEVLPGISVPRLTRAGESPVGVEEALNGQHQQKLTKTRRAAMLMLDILEKEGEQAQRDLFDRVANETELSAATVKRKVYWDILQEDALVNCRKDGFKGDWLVSRSDRERPPGLRPSMTSKSPPSMTSDGHTSGKGHTSGFYEGISTQQLSHTSCVSMSIYDPSTGESYMGSCIATGDRVSVAPATSHAGTMTPDLAHEKEDSVNV